jgi:3-isopropylmalate/(R)-2-methylmalate dehydratase small subunit
MDKFVRLTAKACPLLLANVDTDQILPARYLKLPRSPELGHVLFNDLRRGANGNEKPDFPLNQPVWRDAKILVAGRNFGGGSSREAAVYALYEAGIRCVIAASFGDIFAQNSVKNGFLTAILSEADVIELGAAIAADPELPVTVDLEQLCVHYRSGEPQSTAQRLGRRRYDGKPSRPDRGVQGRGQRAEAVGSTGAARLGEACIFKGDFYLFCQFSVHPFERPAKQA